MCTSFGSQSSMIWLWLVFKDQGYLAGDLSCAPLDYQLSVGETLAAVLNEAGSRKSTFNFSQAV